MELLRCRHCGAPYAFRENLELHERTCAKRPVPPPPPVRRYVLPVGLQREWIEIRDRKWAEGKRWHEWAAGLKLMDDRVAQVDFRQGTEEGVRLPALEAITDPVGTVHHHPHPIGPSWDDCINWVWDAMRWVPKQLNPIFVITFSDNMALAYLLPMPPEVERTVWDEWGKAEKVRKTFTDLGLERPGHAAQVNAWQTLEEKGRIERRYFRLGDSDQILMG